MSLLPFRSYRTTLEAAFLVLAAIAITVTGWEASFGASDALRAATFERLTSIHRTRCRQIEHYFGDLTKHLIALSDDESAISALEEFDRAFPGKEALHRFYIHANPHPLGAKDLLLSAPSAGTYGRIHTRFHPTLHHYQTAFGFYDIFLINPAGRILYTVRKESDLGASLDDPLYSTSALAKAHRRALALSEPERAVLEDYTAYFPSQNEPAAFLAAPIWRGGRKEGVLAVQISIEEVNRVITGDGEWSADGFGGTGQAYMVDAANTLRSGLRHSRTAVLERHPGEPVSGSGTAITADGLHLRSWAPLNVPDVQWTLVAEIDTAEALAPVRRLQLRIAGYGLLIATVMYFVARWLAQSVTAPVLALAGNARRLGARDFRARLDTNRSDEIGQLAASFNRMAEDLEQTTVSKHEVDRILASLLNAVFVTENGRITRANPAAEKLLGYSTGRLVDIPAPIGRAAVETELIRTDGANVPVLLAAARLEPDGGIVYAAQDITELRRLSGRLIAAQEEERRRIARELHDDFSQRLAVAAIAAGQRQDEPVRRQLAALAEDIHSLSRRLHPAMLDDLGLEAAVAAECRAFFERGGPPVDFAVEGAIGRMSSDVSLALYRIVQEGLRNIGRHAAAQQVTVRLRGAEDVVELEIVDDGIGFNREGPDWHPGLGLAGMEERVRLLRGQWSLTSQPGGGVRIHVRISRVANA